MFRFQFLFEGETTPNRIVPTPTFGLKLSNSQIEKLIFLGQFNLQQFISFVEKSTPLDSVDEVVGVA